MKTNLRLITGIVGAGMIIPSLAIRVAFEMGYLHPDDAIRYLGYFGYLPYGGMVLLGGVILEMIVSRLMKHQ